MTIIVLHQIFATFHFNYKIRVILVRWNDIEISIQLNFMH